MTEPIVTPTSTPPATPAVVTPPAIPLPLHIQKAKALLDTVAAIEAHVKDTAKLSEATAIASAVDALSALLLRAQTLSKSLGVRK